MTTIVDKANQYPLGYVTVQGVGSTTFTPPPLDNSMLFGEWIDWLATKCSEHTYVELVGDEGEKSVPVTWGEVSQAVYRLAAHLRAKIQPSVDVDGIPPVISILANPHPLVYVTVILAISRAGFISFPLSVRNSVPALEHLLKKTDSSYLFGSVPARDTPGTALQETTAALTERFPNLHILDVPSIATLYPRLASWPPKVYDSVGDAKNTPSLPSLLSLPGWNQSKEDSPVSFLHSSGSTSFPKAIPLNNRALLAWSNFIWYGDADLCGTRWANMVLPLFHVMGVGLQLVTSMGAGTIQLMFKPSAVPTLPTPQNVIAATVQGKADHMAIVPSILAEWATDSKAVEALARLKSVTFAGGPLAQETGDLLIKHGVRLHIEYGLTEAGPLFKLTSSLKGSDWPFARMASSVQYEMVPEGDGMYRLIVLDSETHGIAVSNIETRRAYDTNDLFEEHPRHKGYWRIVGRADDQIIMSNGEKTNPGPLEDIVLGNPHVRSAIMFGRARNQVGIMIEPSQQVDLTDDAEVSRFRNLIWPQVEKANEFAPTHSRIFKELMLILDPSKKALPRTAKGTVSRNAALKQYEEEIDLIYQAAEQPTQAEWAIPPTQWSDGAIQEFVSRVVNGVMRPESSDRSVDEDRDLFEQGCDSLQATYIRAAITNALREAPKPKGITSSVPQNLVFTYPTVKGLAVYIREALSGVSALPDKIVEAEKAVAQMNALVEKYTLGFTKHVAIARTKTSKGHVVLLTGSTGMLGSYLLQRLLEDERVELVYAVNRSSRHQTLKARQAEAFADRGLDEQLLALKKLRLLEADTSKADLALDQTTLDEIRTSLTTIIHNAWRLDFNLALSAFESNIASTRHLIDLALSVRGPTPAQIIFTSSIATVSSYRLPQPVPEEPLADPNIALGNGYGESKWVAERVLVSAAEQRGLSTTIWRVGQLSGSTRNGAWNTTDWVPIIVKSSVELGVLPIVRRGDTSWVPIDSAAAAIADVLFASNASPEAGAEYLHLVHPHPTAWNNIFGWFCEALSVPTVSFDEWFTRLERAADRSEAEPSIVQKIPAVKLIEFLRPRPAQEQNLDGRYQTKEAIGVDLDTSRAVQSSETLRTLASLSDEDVKRWLGYWKTHGFFN